MLHYKKLHTTLIRTHKKIKLQTWNFFWTIDLCIFRNVDAPVIEIISERTKEGTLRQTKGWKIKTKKRAFNKFIGRPIDMKRPGKGSFTAEFRTTILHSVFSKQFFLRAFCVFGSFIATINKRERSSSDRLDFIRILRLFLYFVYKRVIIQLFFIIVYTLKMCIFHPACDIKWYFLSLFEATRDEVHRTDFVRVIQNIKIIYNSVSCLFSKLWYVAFFANFTLGLFYAYGEFTVWQLQYKLAMVLIFYCIFQQNKQHISRNALAISESVCVREIPYNVIK